MSGGVRYPNPYAPISREAFNDWLRSWPESLASHIALFGKPRVRVPVERQVPNEADL